MAAVLTEADPSSVHDKAAGFLCRHALIAGVFGCDDNHPDDFATIGRIGGVACDDAVLCAAFIFFQRAIFVQDEAVQRSPQLAIIIKAINTFLDHEIDIWQGQADTINDGRRTTARVECLAVVNTSFYRVVCVEIFKINRNLHIAARILDPAKPVEHANARVIPVENSLACGRDFEPAMS